VNTVSTVFSLQLFVFIDIAIIYLHVSVFLAYGLLFGQISTNF